MTAHENKFTVIFEKAGGIGIEMSVKGENLTPEQAYDYVVSKQPWRVREDIKDGVYKVSIIGDISNVY